MAPQVPPGRKSSRRLAASLLAAVLGVAVAIPAFPDGTADTGIESPYFNRHAEGWFWYHDPRIEIAPKAESEPKPELPPDKPLLPASRTADDPAAEVDAERKQLEVTLDRAILHPTPDNVKAYLVLNQQLMNQAGDFADAWRGAIWMNPELDHSLVSPTGAAAYVKADITAADQDQRLASAGQNWGLLFFFRGSCPYCHKFAPLLKTFAARYGFHLVPITLDGGSLPEFPNPQANAGAGEALGVEGVPAVFVVNPKTREVAPAVFGLVGWTELSQRVLYAIDHSGDKPRGQDAATALAATGG